MHQFANCLFLSPICKPGNDDPYEPRNEDECVDLALQRYISNDRLHKTTSNNGHTYADQQDPEMQK